MKTKYPFILFNVILLFGIVSLKAQVISTTSHPFDYGNGSDGAYNPTNSTTLSAGIYNFKSVNLPAGVTITVTGNSPLVIKCQGKLIIAGTLDGAGANGGNGSHDSPGIGGSSGNGGGQAGGQGGTDLDSDGSLGGTGSVGTNYGSCAGGGRGGVGGEALNIMTLTGQDAGGGGGGSYGTAGAKGATGSNKDAGGAAGSTYGDVNLVAQCGGLTNILGGSGGGGGGGADASNDGSGGQGGGGGGSGGGGIAIIADSVSITGSINVSGGNGGNGAYAQTSGYDAYSGGGGGGSGGTVLFCYQNTCIGCTTTYVNISGGNGGASHSNSSGKGGNGGNGRLVLGQDCKNPAFTDTIANQTICQGDSITFIVNATGDNLSYQWIKNSTNISGATNSAYNTGKITSTDNIIYSCKITNECGTISLPSFTLFVNLLPSSNTTPVIQNKFAGDSAYYSVSNTGTSPFSYQWLKNDTNITNATNSSFEIKNLVLGDSGVYKCIITNLCGSTTADIAQLHVKNVRFKFNISGFVRYDNSDTSAMSSKTPNTLTTVYLVNSYDITVDSVNTDSVGRYLFTSVINDTYKLICKTTKAWGGVNPVDALITNRTYIKLYIMKDPIKILAADVNNDKRINPVDALIINRRYIRLLQKFPVPDWLFETTTVTVTGADVKKNILVICTGDVNGSYVPPK